MQWLRTTTVKDVYLWISGAKGYYIIFTILNTRLVTDIVDVPSYAQIKNERDLKFLEHPFDAASYLVDYYFPIARI